MTGKASDWLQRLPSVSELMDKPPVRALADRLNRSVVASGVRSFLDELRTDLERRAADVRLPSLRELAERAARHVARREQVAPRPAINATGQLFSAVGEQTRWLGLPLASDALDSLVALGGNFVLDATPVDAQDVVSTLCRLTGAEAALVVSSYRGAVWLALASLAAERQVVVARAEIGDVEPGTSLVALAAASNVALREVGAVNRVTVADYEAALAADAAAIFRQQSDSYQVVGSAEGVTVESLAALSRRGQRPLVELKGAAPLVAGMPGVPPEWTPVAASVAAGAQLVLVRGDGLVGGPECGIIVGTRELVGRLAANPMSSAWRASAPLRSALQATLRLCDDPARLAQSVPLYQLLTTPLENLQQRAERLAPQLAEAFDVESAVAVSTECLLRPCRPSEAIASWAVAVTARNGDLAGLVRRLHEASVPVLGREVEGRLLIDLRTVFPRQDTLLVEMVAGAIDTPAVADSLVETAAPAAI